MLLSAPCLPSSNSGLWPPTNSHPASADAAGPPQLRLRLRVLENPLSIHRVFTHYYTRRLFSVPVVVPVVVPVIVAFAYMAAPIAHFISLEVGNPFRTPRWIGSLATRGHRATIATLRVVVVIYMTMEVAMSTKPRASANEDTAGKPFRSVVAIGGAGIGIVVVVTVGTFRSDADSDDDLGFNFRSGRYEARSGNRCQSKILESFHDFSARPSGSGLTCPKLVDQEGSDPRDPREGIYLLVGCVAP
jgi:hypothetical protein